MYGPVVTKLQSTPPYDTIALTSTSRKACRLFSIMSHRESELMLSNQNILCPVIYFTGKGTSFYRTYCTHNRFIGALGLGSKSPAPTQNDTLTSISSVAVPLACTCTLSVKHFDLSPRLHKSLLHPLMGFPTAIQYRSALNPTDKVAELANARDLHS